MARSYRTKAIVLKAHKYGEADNILSLLSPEGGRIGAIAKGIRKTKSRFGGRLQPFSHVDLMLHPGRGLHTVTGVESIEPFEEIRADYDRLTHGSAMLDLLDRVAMEGHADERMFGLAVASLRALAGAREGFERILAAFELKLMAIIGYRPYLDGCVLCGTEAEGGRGFSSRAGGVVCESCRPAEGMALPIRSGTVSYMRALLESKMGELDDIEADPACSRELEQVVRPFIAYHVQSRLKGREFLSRS
ncbi:MAG: DNA repair protein RecO [Actinobacteria bacterium]|nr:MAG: DNA repair protein RecO [Actinomycetota bacterium]